jgi:hypothetical protein
MSHSLANRCRVVPLCCAALLVGGCGATATPQSTRSEPSASPDRPIRHFQGANLFPGESLRDWVSYADHVIIYTITDERRMPPDASELETGEGHVLRAITMRVERTIWSAPDAPELPAAIEWTATGWALHEGQLYVMETDDEPRVAVAQRYLAPVVQVQFDDGPRWWPLTPGSQMPLGDNLKVAAADFSSAINPHLVGKRPNEIADIVAHQPPNPLAAQYRALRPQQRIDAVSRAESAREAPGPP